MKIDYNLAYLFSQEECMDYQKIYDRLIDRSYERTDYSELLECHHIIPRSLGGKDIQGNICYLTMDEHHLAHMLLYKLYGGSQIFSVECFYHYQRTKHYTMKEMPRWVRRRCTIERAKLNRQRR